MTEEVKEVLRDLNTEAVRMDNERLRYENAQLKNPERQHMHPARHETRYFEAPYAELQYGQPPYEPYRPRRVRRGGEATLRPEAIYGAPRPRRMTRDMENTDFLYDGI